MRASLGRGCAPRPTNVVKVRILLVSDTHRALSAIDDLVERESAYAVVHAGCFGFYDDASPDRLDGRELFLRVVYGDLSAAEKS